jgi:hypothetical protein
VFFCVFDKIIFVKVSQSFPTFVKPVCMSRLLAIVTQPNQAFLNIFLPGNDQEIEFQEIETIFYKFFSGNQN